MDQEPRPIVACPNASACRDGGNVPVKATAPAASDESPWTRVAADGELPRNGMKAFVVGGVSVLVVHTGEKLVAVQGLCPHEAVPLEHGLVKGATLTCLEHMWRFDVETGQPLDAAEEGLRIYAVKHEDGALYIAL